MAKLSDRLEDISRMFFGLWREWRQGQGWRLGPDLPGALLSPYMVDNWDQLNDGGRTWFRQHAALVLASIEQTKAQRDLKPVVPTYTEREANTSPEAARQHALIRLSDAAEAVKQGDNVRATKLVRVAKVYMQKSSADKKLVLVIDRALTIMKKVNSGKLPPINAGPAVDEALRHVRSA